MGVSRGGLRNSDEPSGRLMGLHGLTGRFCLNSPNLLGLPESTCFFLFFLVSPRTPRFTTTQIYSELAGFTQFTLVTPGSLGQIGIGLGQHW